MCRMRWRTSGRELAATAPTVANPPARLIEAADENKNSTDSSNGGVLDKLSSIKDGLSCPVDLKKFM